MLIQYNIIKLYRTVKCQVICRFINLTIPICRWPMTVCRTNKQICNLFNEITFPKCRNPILGNNFFTVYSRPDVVGRIGSKALAIDCRVPYTPLNTVTFPIFLYTYLYVYMHFYSQFWYPRRCGWLAAVAIGFATAIGFAREKFFINGAERFAMGLSRRTRLRARVCSFLFLGQALALAISIEPNWRAWKRIAVRPATDPRWLSKYRLREYCVISLKIFFAHFYL